MYSPRRSYGSPPPELSNNPFIDHPSNALTRYPDINAGESPSNSSGQFTSWMRPSGSGAFSGNPGGLSSGYGQQQQQQPGYSGGYQQQVPQQTGWNGTPGYQQQQNSGFVSPVASPIQAQPTGRPFQPSSSFGQQLAGHINGAYGVPPQQQQQQQQPQYSGYPPNPQYSGGYQQPQYTPQQPQQTTQYLAEFDPYAQLGSISNTSPTTQYGQGSGTTYQSPHPRDYIRQHKAEMESWDTYTWKQALQTFEALKEAWAIRKREIEARGKVMGGAGLFGGGGGGYGYGGAYAGQAQEFARLEHLAKEAEQNADSVAASTFQMQEAFSGYRQSSDLASKRRVRESINAALTSLPDWPPQRY